MDGRRQQLTPDSLLRLAPMRAVVAVEEELVGGRCLGGYCSCLLLLLLPACRPSSGPSSRW